MPLTNSERQAYINAAIAAGIPSSAIANFLSGNPGDEHRIMSALGPDYARGGTSTVSIQSAPIAFGPAVPAPAPLPAYKPLSPVASMDALTVGAADATISGHALADDISRPQIVTYDNGPRGSGAPAATIQVLPPASASGIPSWAIVAAFAVLAFLFLRK